MGRGAWWAVVHGVRKNWTGLTGVSCHKEAVCFPGGAARGNGSHYFAVILNGV